MFIAHYAARPCPLTYTGDANTGAAHNANTPRRRQCAVYNASSPRTVSYATPLSPATPTPRALSETPTLRNTIPSSPSTPTPRTPSATSTLRASYKETLFRYNTNAPPAVCDASASPAVCNASAPRAVCKASTLLESPCRAGSKT